MSVTIYGASDDLIEVEGDIREEFSARGDDDAGYLAFSNGAVFSIMYAQDGCWRITPAYVPDYVSWTKVEAVSADSRDYSDRVTIDGDCSWVVYGEFSTRRPGHKEARP